MDPIRYTVGFPAPHTHYAHVRADRLDERLEQDAPGNRVAVLVARRDRMLSIDVTLAAEPTKSWRLEPADPKEQAVDRRP